MRILITTLALAGASLLAHPVLAADADAGEVKFKQLCSTCHGQSGQGDGPASASLKPKPRDMSDSEWQASVDDEHLRNVIEKGGASVGLSPTMTAFGHALSDEDLDNIVAYIRSLD